MEVKKEKFGFGRQWLAAVIKWKDYEKLTRVSGGKLTGFVALLLLLCFLVQYIVPGAVDFITGNGFFSSRSTADLLKDTPEFSVENGFFSIDSPVYVDNGGTFLYADDNIDYFSLSDMQDFISDTSYRYQSALIVTRTNLVLYSNYRYQELDFSKLPDLSFRFDEAFLQSLKMLLYGIMAVVLILAYFFSFGLYFFYSLVYSLFGLLFNAVLKGRLSFGELYRASIYAKAGPACLFALIDMSFRFMRDAGLHPAIPSRFWLRVILTLVILFFAVNSVVKSRNASSYGGAGSDNPYQPAGTQPFMPSEQYITEGQPEQHVTTINGQPWERPEN